MTLSYCPFLECFLIKNYYCYNECFPRISIDEDLKNQTTLDIDTLKFLGSDVLSLSKFEYILHSVDDLDSSIW